MKKLIQSSGQMGRTISSFKRLIILFVIILSFILFSGIKTSIYAQSPSNTVKTGNSCIQEKVSDEITTLNKATVSKIGTNPLTMEVQCNSQDKTPLVFSEEKPELSSDIDTYSKGDLVNLSFNNTTAKIESLSVSSIPIGGLRIFATLAVSAIALHVLSLILLKGRLFDLILGEDKRYSNSKFQLAFWFFVVITTYITMASLRFQVGGWGFVGGVNIPQNLLWLSGLSVLTFAGAKGITQKELDNNSDAKTRGTPQFPGDLFKDDNGKVDLGDFEMIIVTFLAVFVYLAEVLYFMGTVEFHQIITLPDVDTTILATFGLGQGAYLTKKLAGRGNTKNENADSLGATNPNNPSPLN